MADENRVILGQFGAAHGIRGEVKLNAYTEDPLGVADYGPVTLDDGRVVEIVAVRMQGDGIVARVGGIGDRTGAETLRNRRFSVDRSVLPPIEEEDDFYYADLVGLRAERADGSPFGTIVAVQNFGAGDLIEILPAPGARSFYLPFTRAVVPLVDIAEGRLVVEPPPEIEAREDDGAAAGEDEA
ncbi:ribosome maturation factor RimM [Mesorhizobium sp. BR1-1-16]|uniref:ribosome maturation factor RimM n=1 Tax=Mesorhizobium sp. BR1-1-16 TaxID=2876653 RepID=UPI001CCFF915|nr:ribosome maturation factor RimM [Mesorhizobium sp. BR1-1-16]MBZ9937439.1 ribosome maturation factor RimM [Mesorhizobium sp. BR1-1-16]